MDAKNLLAPGVQGWEFVVAKNDFGWVQMLGKLFRQAMFQGKAHQFSTTVGARLAK